MTDKHLYTAPEAELLVVRFEENILSGGEPGNLGLPGQPGTDIPDPFEFVF